MKDVYYAVAHRSQKQIDSFKRRYEDFDDSLIPDLFKSALGFTATDWEPSDSLGSAHVIYFVRVKEQPEPLVLRANTGFGESEVVMLIEKMVTDEVLSRGLTTNKVLYVDVSRTAFPFDFQIQEDIGGMDPEVGFPDGEKEYDRLSYELGEYIAKLSDIQFPHFGRFDNNKALDGVLEGTKSSMHDYLMVSLEEDLEYLRDSNMLEDDRVDEVYSFLFNSKSVIDDAVGSLVHHDLADHNLRYKDGHLLAVFDWEAMVVGDEALDLASCPTWGTLYPREKHMLDGFTSIRPLPNNWLEKRDVYLLRTMLWKITYAIRADILNEARLARLTTVLEKIGL